MSGVYKQRVQVFFDLCKVVWIKVTTQRMSKMLVLEISEFQSLREDWEFLMIVWHFRVSTESGFRSLLRS